MRFVTSEKGIEFIKSYEALVLKAYDDRTGAWTIGYGHTAGVMPGMEITESQAVEFLQADLKRFEESVNRYVTVPLTQSFTFNLGAGALKRSTLLKKLNCGDITGAAGQFERFVYAGGKVMRGLVRRRAAEKEIFLNGKYLFN